MAAEPGSTHTGICPTLDWIAAAKAGGTVVAGSLFAFCAIVTLMPLPSGQVPPPTIVKPWEAGSSAGATTRAASWSAACIWVLV